MSGKDPENSQNPRKNDFQKNDLFFTKKSNKKSKN